MDPSLLQVATELHGHPDRCEIGRTARVPFNRLLELPHRKRCPSSGRVAPLVLLQRQGKLVQRRRQGRCLRQRTQAGIRQERQDDALPRIL
jgi:hypothetical protein